MANALYCIGSRLKKKEKKKKRIPLNLGSQFATLNPQTLNPKP